MVFTPCNPCANCIQSNIPNDKFKQDVEFILCQILAATSGETSPLAVFNPQISIAAVDLNAAYTNTGAVNGYKGLYIINTTDSDLEFQFGSSTIGNIDFTVQSNANKEFIFAPAKSLGSLYVRWKGGAANIGSLIIEGWA